MQQHHVGPERARLVHLVWRQDEILPSTQLHRGPRPRRGRRRCRGRRPRRVSTDSACAPGLGVAARHDLGPERRIQRTLGRRHALHLGDDPRRRAADRRAEVRGRAAASAAARTSASGRAAWRRSTSSRLCAAIRLRKSLTKASRATSAFSRWERAHNCSRQRRARAAVDADGGHPQAFSQVADHVRREQRPGQHSAVRCGRSRLSAKDGPRQLNAGVDAGRRQRPPPRAAALAPPGTRRYSRTTPPTTS